MGLKTKDRFCILFFCPKTHPRTFLQCFALYFLCSKAKHCRNVLGRVLGRKNKLHAPSFSIVFVKNLTYIFATRHDIMVLRRHGHGANENNL